MPTYNVYHSSERAAAGSAETKDPLEVAREFDSMLAAVPGNKYRVKFGMDFDDVKRKLKKNGKIAIDGPNITDTHVVYRDGETEGPFHKKVFMIGTDNLEPELLEVELGDMRVVLPDLNDPTHKKTWVKNADGEEATLAYTLQHLGKLIKGQGLDPNLNMLKTDRETCAVRHLVALVGCPCNDKASVDMCMEGYNYQAGYGEDGARNMVLFCNSQGVDLRTDNKTIGSRMNQYFPTALHADGKTYCYAANGTPMFTEDGKAKDMRAIGKETMAEATQSILKKRAIETPLGARGGKKSAGFLYVQVPLERASERNAPAVQSVTGTIPAYKWNSSQPQPPPHVVHVYAPQPPPPPPPSVQYVVHHQPAQPRFYSPPNAVHVHVSTSGPKFRSLGADDASDDETPPAYTSLSAGDDEGPPAYTSLSAGDDDAAPPEPEPAAYRSLGGAAEDAAAAEEDDAVTYRAANIASMQVDASAEAEDDAEDEDDVRGNDAKKAKTTPEPRNCHPMRISRGLVPLHEKPKLSTTDLRRQACDDGKITVTHITVITYDSNKGFPTKHDIQDCVDHLNDSKERVLKLKTSVAYTLGDAHSKKIGHAKAPPVQSIPVGMEDMF